MRYQREGKNLHDDAPDCITGVYENHGTAETPKYIAEIYVK